MKGDVHSPAHTSPCACTPSGMCLSGMCLSGMCLSTALGALPPLKDNTALQLGVSLSLGGYCNCPVWYRDSAAGDCQEAL